jgi:predicted ATPase/class 3 adenylate cyclase
MATRADDGEDRRPVTVVFADLAGFTAIGERLDPEDVRAFQQDLFKEMAEVIERYEGFVEKYVGDAVMAVFGAPIAHEDDPERAVRAALAMHERMARLDARWAHRLGQPVALHVGVNTGPVVAGRLGGEAAAYAVTGDTVNTTARLQAQAAPGQTLVSHATYLLTRHVFAFETQAPLVLKGKAEPLRVHRVVGVEAGPRSSRGLHAEGLTAPLVGRREELDQLLAAFDRAVGGRAQVVSLVGEAGAGKSRLLAELFRRLEARGDLARTTLRQARCSSLGEQPYGVVATFFREGYGIGAEDTLPVAREKIATGLRALGVGEAEAAGAAPVLGYVLGLEAGDRRPDLEPETVKRQIFTLLRLALERRLSQGPVLLVVEDLHWADAASLEGLRTMADWLADGPLVVVHTYRPTFDARHVVTSRTTHVALRLRPLTFDESHTLLGALFGPSTTRIPDAVRELIVKRAGGNPLYLEEIVRDLIADGVLRRVDDGWVCTADAAAVDVPATIQGLILARIDRLPAEARRLLQEAAVLGPVLDPAILRRLTAHPQACATALDALREAELLRDVPASRGQPEGAQRMLAFAHVLVQEAVYQNLLLRRRTELHGAVGEILVQARGERPSRLEDLEALGHHFSLSEQKLRGARYLIAAGDWARGVYANDDALRHYERALRTLTECEAGAADELVARERLADLLGPAGRRQEAAEHYERVRAAADAAGDPATTARLWRKLGGVHWEAGERDRALACLDAGLRLLDGGDWHIELAHACQEMGRLAFRGGDNAGAVRWAERALGHAEQASRANDGDDEEASREAAAAVSHALNTLGAALARLGRAQEAVDHIERSVAVARDRGLLNVACRSYANLGVLYAQLDPGRAIETCLTGLDTAKRIGDLGLQSRLYANLAVAYCALTNRCDADGVSAARAAIDLDRRLGQVDHLAVPLIVLGQIHQCHGEADTALVYYQEASVLAEQIGEPQLLFPCYEGLGTVYLDKGDVTEAERYLVKAAEVCEQAGGDRDSLVVLPFLC